MMNVAELQHFAGQHGLWMVEDAAHAFPAAWRPGPGSPWQRCGEATAAVTCFSFYANKTITTGEGGMAVTSVARLAERMRSMSLHGLSHDAWADIPARQLGLSHHAPGYKYNLTDMPPPLAFINWPVPPRCVACARSSPSLTRRPGQCSGIGEARGGKDRILAGTSIQSAAPRMFIH